MDLNKFTDTIFEKLKKDFPIKDFPFNDSFNINSYNNKQYSSKQAVHINTTGLDIEFIYKFYSIISDEFKQKIVSSILKDIKLNSSKNYINIMGLDESPDFGAIAKKLSMDFKGINIKNIICNGRLHSLFSDLQEYKYEKFPINTSFIFYKYGKVNDVNLHVDAVMKWTDDYILSYDEIYYDVYDLKCDLVRSPNSFGDIVEISFSLYVKTVNPQFFYLIEDTNSSGYLGFKAILRNDKIDKLLD